MTCEYIDIAQNVPGQSVRVYLYDLPAAGWAGELRHAGAARSHGILF
jgi:hypothetical protein